MQAIAITRYWTTCVQESERMPPGSAAIAVSPATA